MEIKRPASKQPMSTNAKKVFSGTIFDVYQWEQELFDGTTQTFEKVKRADTVVTFGVLPDGRILLLKQRQPNTREFISGAGGRIDAGEDPLTAAKRELREETGYEAAEWILWNATQPVGKIDWAVYTFVAKGLVKAGAPHLDAGEMIEPYPVTFEEFVVLSSNPHFSEREVKSDLYEARLDVKKMSALRTLFSV